MLPHGAGSVEWRVEAPSSLQLATLARCLVAGAFLAFLVSLHGGGAGIRCLQARQGRCRGAAARCRQPFERRPRPVLRSAAKELHSPCSGLLV